MGLLTLDFPAFETPAFFTIRLADGEEAVTLVGLPDLVDIRPRRRLVGSAMSPSTCNGFERGAALGRGARAGPCVAGPRRGRPRPPRSATFGGFLTRLGAIPP